MRMAHARGYTIVNSDVWGSGSMAAVGLTWAEAKKRAPQGVWPACHNGVDSVTISGEPAQVDKMVAELQANNVFARKVDSAGVPFHSPMMDVLKPAVRAFNSNACKQNFFQMMRRFTEIIGPNPRRRSEEWISSSVDESEWHTELGQFCSAEYHANNTVSPVLFYEALQKVVTK
jgi:fatty acid synthase